MPFIDDVDGRLLLLLAKIVFLATSPPEIEKWLHATKVDDVISHAVVVKIFILSYNQSMRVLEVLYSYSAKISVA